MAPFLQAPPSFSCFSVTFEHLLCCILSVSFSVWQFFHHFTRLQCYSPTPFLTFSSLPSSSGVNPFSAPPTKTSRRTTLSMTAEQSHQGLTSCSSHLNLQSPIPSFVPKHVLLPPPAQCFNSSLLPQFIYLQPIPQQKALLSVLLHVCSRP